MFQYYLKDYDFQFTMQQVLEEIYENKEKNMIFMTMKSLDSIKKQIHREMQLFKNNIEQNYDNRQIGLIQVQQFVAHIVRYQQSVIEELYVTGELNLSEREAAMKKIDGVNE